jgi:uncharacterized membrane protein
MNASPPPVKTPLPVYRIDAARPFVWLRRGVADMLAAPGPSLLHGIVIAVAGIVILILTLQAWLAMPGAFSGFLLIGPILATGLYELSRRRAAGEQPRLHHAFHAWQRGTRPLVILGVLLFMAATAGVGFSALLFGLFVTQPIRSPIEFLHYAAAGQGSVLFWLWVIAGGLGAALIFALTAVSAPLMLDRRISFRAALLTSVRAVGDNPLPMALWATLILLATALSMATMMIGFVFSLPIIGHATWHAYLDLVDREAAPART